MQRLRSYTSTVIMRIITGQVEVVRTNMPVCYSQLACLIMTYTTEKVEFPISGTNVHYRAEFHVNFLKFAP